MDVKLPTVKTPRQPLLDKLDVKRRAEAKTAAKKLHLVPRTCKNSIRRMRIFT